MTYSEVLTKSAELLGALSVSPVPPEVIAAQAGNFNALNEYLNNKTHEVGEVLPPVGDDPQPFRDNVDSIAFNATVAYRNARD